MSNQPHFHFIVPVWGKAYSKLFVETCLPMILTPGNLYMSKDRPLDRFVIVTTAADWEYMRASDSINALEKIMTVEPMLIDGLIDISEPHTAMSACYAMAMKAPSVIPQQTYFVFLTPDSFWSEGAFKRLIELVDAQYKVVMVAGLRINAEEGSVILNQWLQEHPSDPSMPMPQLIEFVIENLHQISRANNWYEHNGFINVWPSHIYWIDKANHQMLAHCFHMHPLLVQAPKAVTNVCDTIDGAFLEKLNYPMNRYYVVQSEFLGVEMSPRSRSLGQPLGAPNMKSIKQFGRYHANMSHWHFFGHRITLNGNPDTPLSAEMIALCDNVTGEILESRPRSILFYKFGYITHKVVIYINARPYLRYLLYYPYRLIKCFIARIIIRIVPRT